MKETSCESCSMAIESGPYCEYCTDESGSLRGFEETVQRMIQFVMHQDGSLSREQAKEKTYEFMGTMPAWKDHPSLRG